MINDVRFLFGSLVLYVRSNDISATTSRYILYGTSKDNLVNKSTAYWGADALYPNITYVDNLTPLTKYYFKLCATINKKTQESDIYSFYTTKQGTISYSFDQLLDDNGKCYVTDYDNTQLDWTNELKLLLTLIPKALDYYHKNGFIPDCRFSVTYDKNYYNGTAAMSDDKMHFYGLTYMGLSTIIHELSHFMDYNYEYGLSNYSYNTQNSFGYILGTNMKKFCLFWMNFENAGTASHASHCYPFSDYTSARAYENTSFQIQLHHAAAMFNCMKGYDGLIGTANKDIITPIYSIFLDDTDSYFTIQGYKSETYLGTTNGTTISKLSTVIDDNYVWKLEFDPTILCYSIKNVGTNTYLCPLGGGTLSNSVSYFLISKSIYGDDLYNLIQYVENNYSKTRNTFIDNSSKISTTFNPRNYLHSFRILKYNA